MKTKSSPQLHAIRVLLALVVLVTFPSSPALAVPYCDDVYFETYYGSGTQLFIEVECPSYPGAYIFWTSNGTTPTHNGATPTGPYTSRCLSGTLIPIAYNTTLCVTAIAWQNGVCGDSYVQEYCQHNPNW